MRSKHSRVPLVLDRSTTHAADFGEHLYNSRGEVVAIVTEVTMHSRRIVDVTSHNDEFENLLLDGPPDIEIRAVGIGPLQFTPDGPRLRGR
jgi:hypothetical protein